MEPLKSGGIPLEILIKGKDDAANEKNYRDVVEVIRKSDGKVGVFQKEQPKGPFVEEWKKVYESEKEKGGLEEVDVSVDLSAVLSVKDEMELVSDKEL